MLGSWPTFSLLWVPIRWTAIVKHFLHHQQQQQNNNNIINYLSSWQWLKTKVDTTLSSLEPRLSPAMVDIFAHLKSLTWQKIMMRVKFIIDDGNNAMIEVNISLMVFKYNWWCLAISDSMILLAFSCNLTIHLSTLGDFVSVFISC